MVDSKKLGKKIVLVGHLYEGNNENDVQETTEQSDAPATEMGKFLLSIPKDLRRKIKFESDEKGFKNASDYICHILLKRR